MKSAAAATINLVTLLVGIVFGILLAPKLETRVTAQQKSGAATCTNSETVECVAPIMTVGSAGVGTLLSNRVVTDQLVVNNYDMLILENNLITALVQRGVLPPGQAQGLIDASHPTRSIKFQAPSAGQK